MIALSLLRSATSQQGIKQMWAQPSHKVFTLSGIFSGNSFDDQIISLLKEQNELLKAQTKLLKRMAAKSGGAEANLTTQAEAGAVDEKRLARLAFKRRKAARDLKKGKQTKEE